MNLKDLYVATRPKEPVAYALLKTELSKAGINADEQDITILLLPEATAGLDSFYLKAGLSSLVIMAQNPTGLRNAVYWYLHHLGFRWYFPNSAWHIVPKLSTIFKPVEYAADPSFTSRKIWFSYGSGSKKVDADLKYWQIANLHIGEPLDTGHSYGAIIDRNKAAFLAHPEWFASADQYETFKLKGVAGNQKFNVDSEDLIQLIIEDVRKRCKAGDMRINLDPSDSGGFKVYEDGDPLKKSVSDQVYTIVNRVVKALRPEFPKLIVGLYAYNYHSEPPTFDIEPGVYVEVATSYSKSKYTLAQTIELFKQKGCQVGIRDYYSVIDWDNAMPGRQRGGKLRYVAKLKQYHASGATSFNAQSNVGWISKGIGQYIAARLLWDVNQDVQTLYDDFMHNCFPNSYEPMRALFDAWQLYTQDIPRPGDLRYWAELVSYAESLEDDLLVLDRLNQIRLYLYNVYLFVQYKTNPTDTSLTEFLSDAERIKHEGITASHPLERLYGRFIEHTWEKDDPLSSSGVPVNTSVLLSLEGERTQPLELPEAFAAPTLKTSNSLTASLRGEKYVLFTAGEPAFLHVKPNSDRTVEVYLYEYNTDLILGEAALYVTATLTQPLSLALPSGTWIAVIRESVGFTFSFSGCVNYGLLAHDTLPYTGSGRHTLYCYNPGNPFSLQYKEIIKVTSPSNKIWKYPSVDMVYPAEKGYWLLQSVALPLAVDGLLPLVCPDKSYLIIQ